MPKVTVNGVELFYEVLLPEMEVDGTLVHGRIRTLALDQMNQMTPTTSNTAAVTILPDPEGRPSRTKNASPNTANADRPSATTAITIFRRSDITAASPQASRRTA